MTASKTNSPRNLKEVHEKYSHALEKTNELIRRQLLNRAPQTAKLEETLKLSRGKQLRPLFTYAIFDGLNISLDKAIPLAAVFESIHVASLLHDDVIDQCHTRRNMPTMNDLYGNGVAILLGDLVFVAIYRLAASMNKVWLIEEVSNTVSKLIEGELLQQQQRFNPQTAESDYETIISGKTAALLELCCYASARFTGQSDANAELLKKFGTHFGIMFQIVDDWADFMRSEENDHKDRGVDIANGFITLPWLILLNQADVAEYKQLTNIIERRQPSGMGEPFIKEIAIKYSLSTLMAAKLQRHKDSCEEILLQITDLQDDELRLFLNFVMSEFHKIAESE